jgi:transposase-like protein
MLKTQEECLALLEQIRWQGRPQCPYCDSRKASRFKREHRYHCNGCFTSFSVTVGTLFHKTHVKLPKWFQAIRIVMTHSQKISVRQLAAQIEVNKNTAAFMLARIQEAAKDQDTLLRQLKEQCRT